MVDTRSVPCIGFIGMGQLGYALATGLSGQGLARVLVFDPYCHAQRQQQAVAAGVELAGQAQALQEADFILSAVTAKSALQAAHTGAEVLSKGALFIDLNSLGEQQKKENAQLFQAQEGSFIDAAVLGPAADGIRVPIILSGPRAQQASVALNQIGLNTRAVGQEPGQASSIKIVRSLLAKGLEALYVEALVAAQRLGIEHEVLGTFAEMLDGRSAEGMAELLVTTHVLHAERRMDEMEMSIEAIAATGMEPNMAQAAYRVLARTAHSPSLAQQEKQLPQTWSAAIELLDRHYQADELSDAAQHIRSRGNDE